MNLNFKSCGRKKNLNVEKNLAVGSRIDFLGRSTLALAPHLGAAAVKLISPPGKMGGPKHGGNFQPWVNYCDTCSRKVQNYLPAPSNYTGNRR